MTVNQNISFLQGILRDHDNNKQFSNQFVYQMIIDARAEIISKKLDRYENISKHSWQKFCIELQSGETHSCGQCIPAGLSCTAYISKYPIPEVINGKIRDYIDVMTLSNKIIDYIREEDADIIQYDDYRKRKPFYSMVNGYLILWNSTIKAGVQLRGLWHNPVDWIGKQLCTATTTCYDADNMQLYIPVGLRLQVFNRALELLQVPLKLTEQDIQAVEKNLAV